MIGTGDQATGAHFTDGATEALRASSHYPPPATCVPAHLVCVLPAAVHSGFVVAVAVFVLWRETRASGGDRPVQRSCGQEGGGRIQTQAKPALLNQSRWLPAQNLLRVKASDLLITAARPPHHLWSHPWAFAQANHLPPCACTSHTGSALFVYFLIHLPQRTAGAASTGRGLVCLVHRRILALIQCLEHSRCSVMSVWTRKWQPTPVFLPEEAHGQRSLAGYSPWSLKRVEHG